MKTGLVLEGGAMRGMFTADACFGCNYKSHHMGRVLRRKKKEVEAPKPKKKPFEFKVRVGRKSVWLVVLCGLMVSLVAFLH